MRPHPNMYPDHSSKSIFEGIRVYVSDFEPEVRQRLQQDLASGKAIVCELPSYAEVALAPPRLAHRYLRFVRPKAPRHSHAASSPLPPLVVLRPAWVEACVDRWKEAPLREEHQWGGHRYPPDFTEAQGIEEEMEEQETLAPAPWVRIPQLRRPVTSLRVAVKPSPPRPSRPLLLAPDFSSLSFHLEDFDGSELLSHEDALVALKDRGAISMDLEHAEVVFVHLEEHLPPTSPSHLALLTAGKKLVRFDWVIACLRAREKLDDAAWVVSLPPRTKGGRPRGSRNRSAFECLQDASFANELDLQTILREIPYEQFAKKGPPNRPRDQRGMFAPYKSRLAPLPSSPGPSLLSSSPSATQRPQPGSSLSSPISSCASACGPRAP